LLIGLEFANFGDLEWYGFGFYDGFLSRGWEKLSKLGYSVGKWLFYSLKLRLLSEIVMSAIVGFWGSCDKKVWNCVTSSRKIEVSFEVKSKFPRRKKVLGKSRRREEYLSEKAGMSWILSWIERGSLGFACLLRGELGGFRFELMIKWVSYEFKKYLRYDWID